MDQLQAKSEALGWASLKFQTGYISDFESDPYPDVVLALHACDTATDDVEHSFTNVGEIAQQEGGEVNAGVGEGIEVHSLTVVTRQRER